MMYAVDGNCVTSFTENHTMVANTKPKLAMVLATKRLDVTLTGLGVTVESR